jgi:hypothetical protein
MQNLQLDPQRQVQLRIVLLSSLAITDLAFDGDAV